MHEMTITEALAEINTITKRIAKQRDFILANAAVPSDLKDPLEKQGGSEKVIQEKLQSVRDLEKRLVALRRAVAAVNAETKLIVEGVSRSIADWLVWKREIAPEQVRFLNILSSQIHQKREGVDRRNRGGPLGRYPAEGEVVDLDVHVDETWIQDEVDRMEKVLGALDGKLSLINATTTLTIDV